MSWLFVRQAGNFDRTRRPVRRRSKRDYRFEALEVRTLMAADLLNVDQSQYATEHFLVQFREGISPSAILGTSIAGATVSRQVSSDGWYQATLNSNANLSSALQAFQNLTSVALVTPDFRVSVTATPNDTNFASQWALENNGAGGVADADIDASQAWNYGTSSSVVVAVIDTGIDYNHVDLASNIWTNTDEVAGNGIDDDRNGYVDDTRGWNFVSDTNNPMDDNGHGTHVAGTIGAVGNNGLGISGVAWNVKLMALKFLDGNGSGMLSDAVSAIDYARVNGAKIINASWGGGGFTTALQSAIQRFQNAGGVFVAAAGNEGRNNATTASYPANYSGVISVAASTASDTLASFSNFGTNVEIAAPGQSILSTIPGNRYASYSGTSMASPHVAGALALLWGQSPGLTATQLVSLITTHADPVLLNRTTHGRLNVGRAAAALAGNNETNPNVDTTSPYVSGAVFNRVAGGIASIDVTFSEAVRATTMVSSAFQVTGPGGTIAITSVALVTGNTWRISFANQTAAGNYTLSVLPTITDNAGNLLDQDRDAVAGEATQDRYTTSFALPPTTSTERSYTRTGPIALQDATWTRVGTTSVAIDVPDSFTISDLNVNVSIDHAYVSDLRLRLIAPDGTSVLLVNRRGGSRDNVRVTFDDEAATSIATTSGNLEGSFRPERALSAFDGKNATGRWFLEIVDAARLDAGRLNSVQLQFAGSNTNAAAVSPLSPTVSWLPAWASAVLEEWQRRLWG
ncbi:MAG: S8 family serine peptidase [Pirellulaceae bacterium]|nr:S8 family serine peptidase [Pirellulaceae bacterium]